MKKNICKAVVLVLCVVMITGAFTGCGAKEKGSADSTEKQQVSDKMNMTGMPIVKEPITLKMMVGKNPSQSEYSKMLIWTEYEKLSGVHVVWTEVPQNNLVEKRNLALASGDLPDVFFKANIPAKDIQSYGEQGVFVKLNDLLDKFAPNVKKAVTERKEVEKGMKMVGGSIYSLPYIMDVLSPAITGKMFINRKWVDKLGMKLPSTTDELYSLLKAIKANDLNDNKKNDEIPLTAPSFNMLLSSLRGAWGLGNRGNANGYVDMDEKANKLRFWPADTKYRDMLVYMNKLFQEGLIDQDIFMMDQNKLVAKGGQNLVGGFAAINHNAMGQKYQDDYEGIPAALKGPSGDQLWSPINAKIWDLGAFAITNSNKYPDITMRWVDYFYSEEGVKLYFMGKEGVTYKVTPQGKYEYTDEINKNPNGMNYDQAMGQYLAWGGNGNPSIAMEKYFLGAAMLPIPLEAANRLKPYLPKEVWPEFSYTSQENDKKGLIAADINNYVSEMTAKFVTGKSTISEWDSYVNQLKNMKLDEYVKIHQDAYDRYIKQ